MAVGVANPNRRHKNSSNLIDQLLNWGLAALSVLDHFDDLRQHGLLANFHSFELKTSFLIDGSCEYFFVYLF